MSTRSIFRNCIIGVVVLVCFAVIFLRVCEAYNKHRKIEYYSNRENYVNVSGEVAFFSYSDESQELNLGFTNLEPHFSNWSYLDFKIVGKNVGLLNEREIENKIKIGDTISFIATPNFFGSGYIIPIVGLTVDGEVLLEFEEGYANLLEWLKE